VFLFGSEIVRLLLDEHVLSPTLHARTFSEAIVDQPHLFSGKSVLDVGTGSGIFAILAAKLGATSVDILDINEKVIYRAIENARLNQVNFEKTLVGDWLNVPPPRKYDVIVSNPSFFIFKDKNRRVLIDLLIAKAPEFLAKSGKLIFVHSSMAGFEETEQALARAGFDFVVLKSQRGLFREDYFREEGFLEYASQVKNGFEVIDGQ